MCKLPQEIRVSSVKIPFVDVEDCCVPKALVSITGGVVTEDGKVHGFIFERGSVTFTDKKSITSPFDRTIQRKLEIILEAYSHGIMKLNVITCNFDAEEQITELSELEE